MWSSADNSFTFFSFVKGLKSLWYLKIIFKNDSKNCAMCQIINFRFFSENAQIHITYFFSFLKFSDLSNIFVQDHSQNTNVHVVCKIK